MHCLDARQPVGSTLDLAQPTRTCGVQVVVTGSSRGLGLELARHFLQLGDDVVLSSRTAAALENAALKLRRVRHRPGTLHPPGTML